MGGRHWKLHVVGVLLMAMALAGCSSAGVSGVAQSTPSPEAESPQLLESPSAVTVESAVPTPSASPASQEVPQTTTPGEATSPSEEGPPQEVRSRLFSDIVSLDSYNITTISDEYIASNVHCKLVSFVPGTYGDIQPDLATEWSTSEDGLTWTFTLRKDAVFHKGYGPITAEDVKYSLDRLLFGDEPSPNAAYISNISSVEVVDPYTVRLHLSKPQASLLTGLAYRAGFILSKRAVEEMGDQFDTNPVGCGPYVFESWSPGAEVVLVRNKEYYGPAPTIDRAVFKVIPDDTVAGLALQNQELDIIITRSAETLATLQAQNPDFVVDSTPSTSIRFLSLNTSKPPFNDVRVRRAVAHAINKDQIVDVLKGTVSRADNVLGRYKYATEDIPIYEYDPDKARQLLSEAGYPNGLDLDLTFTQLAPWPDIVPVVAENLKAVGIRLNLTSMEHGAWTAYRKTGDYLINVAPLGRPPDPDLPLQIAFHSSAFPPGSNESRYDQIDDLIEAGATEMDDSKRAEIYAEIQKKLAEDVPVVPLVYQNVVAVMWPYVRGYKAGINNEFWLSTLSIEK